MEIQIPMIMGNWVWASHEEADDNSKENESQDGSQKQNKQNLIFYIIMYIWSFKRDLLLVLFLTRNGIKVMDSGFSKFHSN